MVEVLEWKLTFKNKFQNKECGLVIVPLPVLSAPPHIRCQETTCTLGKRQLRGETDTDTWPRCIACASNVTQTSHDLNTSLGFRNTAGSIQYKYFTIFNCDTEAHLKKI